MKTFDRCAAMQSQALDWRAAGLPVALVPTMGALHVGHANLVTRAREAAGSPGKVVVSMFVNRPQFDHREDFDRYPQPTETDTELCRRWNVDAVFVPRSEPEIYGTGTAGAFSVFVEERELGRTMEGASRPGHFRGVTTVVAILFNICQPSFVVFGEKDYQQAAIVKKSIEDLKFPIQFILEPTAREPDGLAVSTRNARLNASQRAQAGILWRCIETARGMVRQRPAVPADELKTRLTGLLRDASEVTGIDYVEIFHPQTLQPQCEARRRHRLALAVRFGSTRLIDNGEL